jgi:HSF-type DNA-binding
MLLTHNYCRQLNLYGFIKQKSGSLQGYYTHPCFCRGDTPLLSLIGRNKGAVQPPTHHTGSRTGSRSPAAKRARSTRNSARRSSSSRSYAAENSSSSSSDEQLQEQEAPIPQPVPQQAQSLPVGLFAEEDDFVCLDRVALPMLFATMMAQTRVQPPGVHACTLLPPSPTVLHSGCFNFQAFSSAT